MSLTHCDICGMDWKYHGTACSSAGVANSSPSTCSEACVRLTVALDGLIQECEYSASSGLPFNALGQEWTQLGNAKRLISELRQNDERSGTAEPDATLKPQAIPLLPAPTD